MTPIQISVLARLFEGKIDLDSMDRREREKTERILRALAAKGLTLQRGGRWCCSVNGSDLVKAARAENLC